MLHRADSLENENAGRRMEGASELGFLEPHDGPTKIFQLPVVSLQQTHMSRVPDVADES